jgi:hypothetical protein
VAKVTEKLFETWHIESLSSWKRPFGWKDNIKIDLEIYFENFVLSRLTQIGSK